MYINFWHDKHFEIMLGLLQVFSFLTLLVLSSSYNFFLFTWLYYEVDQNNLLKFLSLFNWIRFLGSGNCLVSL